MHAFAKCERWKEEVIKVTEEMKWLVCWHKYKIVRFKAAASRDTNDSSWMEHGKNAWFHILARKWELRFDRLDSSIHETATLYYNSPP